MALGSCLDINSVNRCLDDLENLTDIVGINTVVRKFEDKSRIDDDIVKWCVLGKTRPAIEALKDGLST